MKMPIPAPAPAADQLESTGRRRTLAALMICAPLGAASLAGCGSGGGNVSNTPTPTPSPPGPPVNGPAWSGYGGNVQHTAVGAIATQAFGRIRWQTPVDLAPQYTGSALLIHYGSPVISARNTVLVSVKTGATGGFRIEARDGFNGVQLWSLTSNYALPPHSWVPSFGATLSDATTMVMPMSGGRLRYRDAIDNAIGATRDAVFYTAAVYNTNPAAFDAAVIINTPLTVDAAGTVYFGFIATTNPAGLVSGIARVAANGTGTWVSAASAANDAGIGQVAMSCAPALSNDGATLYVAVNTPRGSQQSGYLLALNSADLTTRAAVPLVDPASGAPAWINDNGTSSPTVGPDGDVYYGVLEANAGDHNFRGWLLHFDSTLATLKTPGSFGWDITPSIVPKAMVPTYAGTSQYLIATKYNNYYGAGSGATAGDGRNAMAILDPNATQSDPIISTVSVMQEIRTKVGPTIDPGKGPNSVKEWCVNTSAIDPATKSVIVNNEDGKLYRWDLPSNNLTEVITLTAGLGEAYTPTVIGPDGAVYAINNATLFSVGT